MSLVLDVSYESEPEEDPVEDADTVSDISSVFKQQFMQIHQESVSLKKKYITSATSSSDFSKIAIGLEKEMQIYDVTQSGFSKYVGKNDFGKFDHNVCGLKFFNNDANILLVSTICGEIHMYDLRTFAKVHTFEDDTEVVVKPINCFDVNSNNRLISAGTDELNNEVYLLFFDISERRLMGGFFESHQEEITDVKFHPTDKDILASCSTDGLINVFDCQKESEDDALKYTINCEDSIANINWHHQDQLSCITTTNDLHLYNVNEQDLIKKWDRAFITDSIKRKSVIDCNLVNCFNYGTSEMMVLATSNFNKGECIRSLKFDEKSMKPMANFSGNSQIIRTSLYNEKDNLFYTFGEGSIISVWKEGSAENTSDKINSKDESSLKKKLKQKSKPY